MSNNSNEADQTAYLGVLLTVTVMHIFKSPRSETFLYISFICLVNVSERKLLYRDRIETFN
jgi:hypothetical protein